MQDQGEDLRDRPLGELLKQLSEQTSTLVRQELELAKAELTDRAKKAAAGAGLLGAAGVVGLCCLGAFTAFVILLLALALPAWAAALIVAAVYGVIALVLALRGRDKLRQASPPAPQTVETVKEDVKWAKTQTRSANR